MLNVSGDGDAILVSPPLSLAVIERFSVRNRPGLLRGIFPANGRGTSVLRQWDPVRASRAALVPSGLYIVQLKSAFVQWSDQ